MVFWTEPQMASIHKMLNPRSIAIVGATPRMQYGGRFLAAALKAKDRIRVYAVNPRYDEIMGVKSYPTVTSLPEAPDVVGIVVPWDQVLDVLQESHRKGAGSAIVISAALPSAASTTGAICSGNWVPLPVPRACVSAAPTAWGSPMSKTTSGPPLPRAGPRV